MEKRDAYYAEGDIDAPTTYKKLLQSLEGKVVDSLSRTVWHNNSRRILELKIVTDNENKPSNVLFNDDTLRVDVGEHVIVHYSRTSEDLYYGEAIEILDEDGTVKFAYAKQGHTFAPKEKPKKPE